MARRGGTGGNGSRGGGSQRIPNAASADFWKSFGASNPNGTTPSTPSTPSSTGRAKNRWANDLESRQRTRETWDDNPAVARNLELAYQGDDEGLLPYRPTKTINPLRPRTLAAGYDSDNEVLFVRFRDGAGYEYHNVTRSQWREFKATPSPGKYINAELNHHFYAPADW